MVDFNRDNRLNIGFSRALPGGSDQDNLTPAERELLEKIAERLIEEHGETLKKLGDE